MMGRDFTERDELTAPPVPGAPDFRVAIVNLYGVKPGDPAAVAGAVMLLFIVALAAGLVPSARAARLDPTTALRHE